MLSRRHWELQVQSPPGFWEFSAGENLLIREKLLQIKLYSLTWGSDVSMTNVYAVIHTQAHRDHDVDAGDDVDGDVPQVEEANDVHQGDPNHHHHHEAHLKVCKQDEGDQEYGSDSETKVPP